MQPPQRRAPHQPQVHVPGSADTPAVQQGPERFRLYFIGEFRRPHWERLRDSAYPNSFWFSSSTESHTASVYTDLLTDYVANIKLNFSAMYSIAPDDTARSFHNLFNGGGNLSFRASLPLVFAGSSDARFNRYVGLCLAPRIGAYLPGITPDRELQIVRELGMDLLFGLVTDARHMSFSGSLRTAWSFGHNTYLGRFGSEDGGKIFGYELLTLCMKMKHISFSTRMPLRIWYQGMQFRNLPAFISLAVNY